MSDFLKKIKDMSWEEYWEEYKKIPSAYTKEDLPQTHKIIFGKIIHSQNISSKLNHNKAKQVFVKNIANMDRLHTKNALSYALTKSENSFLMNEKGEELSLKELIKDWSKTYATREHAKEAWHLVFSVDENHLNEKSIRALRESVKETMSMNFFGHKYAMILHNHQSKPHIHVILNKYNFLEHKRLHFQKRTDIKYFFSHLREDFSYALRARGLNYENKNPLEKDLRLAYEKSQNQEQKINTDAQFAIRELYAQFNEKFQKEIQLKRQKITHLQDEYENMKKTHAKLEELLEQYIRHKNKKMFALYKELKEHSKEMSLKSKECIREIKHFNTLHYKLQYSQQKQNEHYKEQFQNVLAKRNFLQNYERLFPRHKGASKSEIQNYYRVKKSLQLSQKEAEKTLKNYSENFYKDLFYENTNLFVLQKQYKSLDENLYRLKSADFFLKEKAEPFIQLLQKNKAFIKECSEKRFAKIEKAVLEKNFGKNQFLLKEYTFACEFLQKENKMKKSFTDKKFPSKSYEKTQERYKNSTQTQHQSLRL